MIQQKIRLFLAVGAIVVAIAALYFALRPSADVANLGAAIDFRQSKNILTFPNKGNAYGVAKADFNGDSKIDLVVTTVIHENNADTSHVSILLNNDNGGGFDLKEHLVVPVQTSGAQTTARSIVATDINQDGKQDVIVTAQERKELLIYYGNGDGSFNTPIQASLTVSPYTVRYGDFNGDSKVDLLAVGDKKTVILQRTDQGVFNQFSSTDMNFGAGDIAVSDLNGDNKLDFIASGSSERRLYSYINNGSGSFTVSESDDLRLDPNGIYTGDFDGDGGVDVIVSAYNTTVASGVAPGFVQIPKNSSGKLVAPTGGRAFGSQENIWRGNTIQGEPLDLDGDGDLDVVFVHAADHRAGYNYLTVGLNNGRGEFNVYGWVASPGPGDGYLSSKEWIEGVNIQSATAGDFNQDGAVDVVMASVGVTSVQNAFATTFTTRSGKQSQKRAGDVSILYGNAEKRGQFLGARSDSLLSYLSSLNGSSIRNRGVVIKDVTGDNKADLLVLGKGIQFLAGGEQGLWEKPKVAMGPDLLREDTKALRSADFDQDGTADLAWTSREASQYQGGYRRGRHLVAFGRGNGLFGGVGQNLPDSAKSSNSAERAAQPDQVVCSSINPGSECWRIADADERSEWSSANEKEGAWSELKWNLPKRVTAVKLADRPNSNDHILAGELIFSDGSRVAVGELFNGGEVKTITLPEVKETSSIQFNINQVGVNTENVGLAHFAAVLEGNLEDNVAPRASVTCSGETGGQGCANLIDGDWNRPWTANQNIGSNFELAWDNPVTVGRVELVNRPLSEDQGIIHGRLIFTKSNGEIVEQRTGALHQTVKTGGGTLSKIVSLQNTIEATKIKFVIDEVAQPGKQVGFVGLGEVLVYGNRFDSTKERNLARESFTTCSSQIFGYFGRYDDVHSCFKAIDGNNDPKASLNSRGGEWHEWASTEKNPKLNLFWEKPVKAGRIVLYDRAKLEQQVKSGKITIKSAGEISDPVPDTVKSADEKISVTTSKRRYRLGEAVKFYLKNETSEAVQYFDCAGNYFGIKKGDEVSIAQATCEEGATGAQSLAANTHKYGQWDQANGEGGSVVAGTYTLTIGSGDKQASISFEILDQALEVATIDVGELPNDGSAHTIALPNPMTISSLKFEVTDALAEETGLLEIEVFESSAAADTVSTSQGGVVVLSRPNDPNSYTDNLVTGDFNGDSHPDIATLTKVGGGEKGLIEIWLYSTTSPRSFTYGTELDLGPMTTRFENSGLDVGDINNDGKLDLVAYAGATKLINDDVRRFLPFLGKGDGTFNRGEPIGRNWELDAHMNDLKLADVNNDTKLDLVAAGHTDIHVALGHGNGTFGVSNLIRNPYSQTLGHFQVVDVADFDSNNVPDLVATYENAGVGVFPGRGDGVFGDYQPIVVGTRSVGMVVAGNINADTKPDLVVSHSGQNNYHLTTLYNLSNKGVDTVSLSANKQDLIEEAHDQADLTLARLGSLDEDLLVNLDVSGSASHRLDFEKIEESYIIPAGQTSITFPLKVIDDSFVDSNEVIGISIEPKPDQYSIVNQSVNIGIFDEDQVSAEEGDGVMRVVKITPDKIANGGKVTVRIFTQGIIAEDGVRVLLSKEGSGDVEGGVLDIQRVVGIGTVEGHIGAGQIITTIFNLDNIEVGGWNLVVERNQKQAKADIDILPSSSLPIEIEVQILGRNIFRAGRLTTYQVVYNNTSEKDIFGIPVITINDPAAQLTANLETAIEWQEIVVDENKTIFLDPRQSIKIAAKDSLIVPVTILTSFSKAIKLNALWGP